MARPNKPTSLKVLQGTIRAGRTNPNEPQPAELRLGNRPPSWLSERGKKAWRDILPLLRHMKVITVADPLAFAMLCDVMGEYIEARVYVIANGNTQWVEGKDGEGGYSKARPEVAIAQDAWRRAKYMLTEFGMTPASRAKVSAVTEQSTDPLEKWAQG